MTLVDPSVQAQLEKDVAEIEDTLSKEMLRVYNNAAKLGHNLLVPNAHISGVQSYVLAMILRAHLTKMNVVECAHHVGKFGALLTEVLAAKDPRKEMRENAQQP